MRGRAAGALEGVASKRWRQLERFAQALRKAFIRRPTEAVKSSKPATPVFLISSSTEAPRAQPV